MERNFNDKVNGAEPASGGDSEPMGEEALHSLFAQGREFKEYAMHYAAAMLSAKRAAARDAVIYAAIGALAAVVAATVLITCAVFVLNGIAGGLGVLFGNRVWLGQLVTGAVVLGGIGGGTYAWLLSLKQVQAKSAAAMFEEKRRKQREKFGHDVYSHPRAPL